MAPPASITTTAAAVSGKAPLPAALVLSPPAPVFGTALGVLEDVAAGALDDGFAMAPLEELVDDVPLVAAAGGDVVEPVVELVPLVPLVPAGLDP